MSTMPRNTRTMYAYAAMAFFLLILGTDAAAQVFVSQNGDNTTGDTWATAYTDIQTAIDAAAVSPQDVWVAAGDYSVTAGISMASNMGLYGGFPSTGNPGWDDRDPGVHTTTLDGGGVADHVVSMETVENVRVDGFTVTGGWSRYYPGIGGGFCCTDVTGESVIANCEIWWNRAEYGGGILVMDSVLRVESCSIHDNPVARYGGGLCSSSSNVTVSECTFENNENQDKGGACYFVTSTAVVVDCEMRNNSAGGSGGGIYCHTCDGLDVDGCVIEGNASCYSGGGGLIAVDTPATVTNSIISNNSAYRGGGGIAAYYDPVTVSNSIISNNSAETGGGLDIYGSSGEYSRIINCLIANNTATDTGGGIFTGIEEGPTTITNCTIVGNSAANGGGGIFVDESNTTIVNTIFAHNENYAIYEGQAGFNAAPTTCLFYDNPQGHFYDLNTATTFTTIAGPSGLDANVPEAANNIEGDPVFVDPSGEDYHLAYSSPCIDAGTATGAPDDDFEGNFQALRRRVPRPRGNVRHRHRL